jgi:aryl-alcohol dehydrogenase
MEIKAAVVYESGGPFKVENVQMDEPKKDEVVVKIVAAGVCHTDEAGRSFGMGVMPVILGHEGAGIVEKVGEGVTDISVGDHVILTYAHCGECRFCNDGKAFVCDSFVSLNTFGKMADGSGRLRVGDKEINNFFGQSSFATHAILDKHGVIKVDKDVDLKYLGPLGCGFQTGMGAVLGFMNAQKGGALAVFGCGAVGFGGIIGGLVAGCKTVIAVGGTPDKLKIAEEIGATHTINRRECPDIAAKIKEITGEGVDYALDTSGNADMIGSAIGSLGRLGHLTLVGLTPDITVPAMAMMTGTQSLSAICEGGVDPHVFIPQMVSYVKDGRFPIQKLCTFYPLDEIGQALKDQESGKTIKPIIVMP